MSFPFPLGPLRRVRLHPDPPPTLPSSSEEDSDDSSPERGRPRVVHIPAPKHARRSGEHVVIPDNGTISRGAPGNSSEGTHITVSFDKPPDTSHPERPAKKPSMSGVASDSLDALQPSAKPTLIRRVTSKLHISIPLKPGPQGLRSRPSIRTLPADTKPSKHGPPFPRATIAAPPTLPNSFVSKQHREAALRERGLLPRKDYSEQEREADKRLDLIPSPSSMTFGGSTEAEQLKADWLATNRTSESSDSDCGPPAPPHLFGTRTGPRSMPTSPTPSAPPRTDILRRSDEGQAELPCAGRPSICSSLPPLSTSHLEVLHEDPSEQGPITPPAPLSPAYLPIILSSPVEDPSFPMIVESPVSCTFSSHCPGSTLESQSQSDHHHTSDNRSRASRRRTSDSAERPRKAVGSSLSRMGTRSLSNLHRSIAESLRRPSTSTLSSSDHAHSMAQAPRTAISPTMHSLASILKETGGIEDAESRRLSELAFLD